MNCTITALFENQRDAEQARERLLGLNLRSEQIDIHASESDTAGRDGDGRHKGFLETLKDMFMPDDDRDTYSEGVRRGHSLLTVQVDDDDDADRVVRELESMDAIDVDTRAKQWAQTGWQRQDATSALRAGRTDQGGTEERIPVVEEELVVGKRDVTRGGARVRAYTVEQPVHEQVRLRQERVRVDRRPVDQEIDAADAVFEDREIEVTETSEEAVIGKKARIREEVVVTKEAEETVEDIDETVRHTEVDIDDHLAARATKDTGRSRDLSGRPRN